MRQESVVKKECTHPEDERTYVQGMGQRKDEVTRFYCRKCLQVIEVNGEVQNPREQDQLSDK